MGREGESAAFHVRYFELDRGGYTSLETHSHIHLVIGARGKGKVIADDKIYDFGVFDVIYIGPDVPHQFINDGEEPFGFFCIVDAERDDSKPLTKKEIEEILKNPGLRGHLKLPEG